MYISNIPMTVAIIGVLMTSGCTPGGTSGNDSSGFNSVNSQNSDTNNQNSGDNGSHDPNDRDYDGIPVPYDCDDTNPNIRPGIPEICNNGIDDNCNGFVDAEEPDDDGDGYNECTGDCNDSNPLVGPGAVEYVGDRVDNDCDGEIDEDDNLCDCGSGEMGVMTLAEPHEALGLCNGSLLAETPQMLHAASYTVVMYDPSGNTPNANGWGAIHPIPPLHSEGRQASCQFLVLTTGMPLDPNPQESDNMELGYICPHDPVEDIDNAEPDDQPAYCADLTQYRLVLRVPVNAYALSFDFLYLSTEYPEWVGSEYNDTFYAILHDRDDPGAGTVNVSFDSRGKAITVNNDFFETPPNLSVDITGTGYEGDVGSTTGWLKTTVPVTPGHTIELTFSIHDEGDGILDSAVIIDNLTWDASPVDGPVTVD